MVIGHKKFTWQFLVGITCIVVLLISWVPEFFKLAIHDSDTKDFKEETRSFKKEIRDQLEAHDRQIESLTRGLQMAKPSIEATDSPE